MFSLNYTFAFRRPPRMLSKILFQNVKWSLRLHMSVGFEYSDYCLISEEFQTLSLMLVQCFTGHAISLEMLEGKNNFLIIVHYETKYFFLSYALFVLVKLGKI